MTRLFTATAIASLLVLASPAVAMTDAECAASWTKTDVNKTGSVDETAARQYFAMLRVAGKPITEGNLTQAMFLEHCKSGHFDAAMVEPGAPLEGANSFTESQAQDRIVAAGFSEVSTLVKDEQGVWRGTGSKDSAVMKVAVDFKGNVVSQ